MKTLFVLRHAKSSWADPGLADRDRPLARRGERDTRRLAAHVERAGIRPDVILCSPARRARATLDALVAALGHVEPQVDEALYGASEDEIVGLLARLPAVVGSVMVVGHNPGLEDLVALLASDGEPGALRQLHTKFPTGALATLDLDVADWTALGPGVAFVQDLVIPKGLPDA